MTSSPSPFSNNNKLQVLPQPTTLLFTQSANNNLTINNIGNTTQNIRQTNIQNGSFIQQQQLSSGTITTPTSIVRLNQPLQTQNQYQPHTVWTSNTTQLSPKVQYSPTIKNEPTTPGFQQQSSILPTKVVTQPVVRQTVVAPQQAPKFTDAQISDFVGKCRTFLTTLLKLAEKQAPEKLPMVRSCIQDLLEGTIDPESFTQRLHTLYKSQPHTSLVPFFKLALPYMRQIVKNTFGQPITIELLEKLNLPSNKSNTIGNISTTPTTSRVVVNPSLLSQQSTSGVQQPLLYTTVQPQQKINLLQQTSQSSLIGSTASLLGQQQQQQQQARAQISITGIRPIVASVSPSSNTNLLTGQPQIQPITQTIIQQSDSFLQRTFLSPSTALQQPQIITVNHQPIRTDIVTGQKTSLTNISSLQQQQQPQIQLQPRVALKNDDDTSDDILGNSGLLTASSGVVDDRHTRHITHDNRLLSTMVLRRRLDHLIKKDKRWEGINMTLHDDSVLALISNATEERLKCLIESIKTIAQQRTALSSQTERSQMEEQDNNETMLSFGKGEKRKFEENINQHERISSNQPTTMSSFINSNKKCRLVKRKCQANLRDLIVIMERDKHLKRSSLLFNALDKAS
ncbi:unnamed protein product [Adineta steineri]|uniref:TAFH domain-containing protein n=1 Tax=Adineta steineri TaxID=433720 RepID=A0A814BPL4_9BILA|nr:unnamed protein product [Adineta steineri]CAF3603689.1 unnamed protein product [Adineta steineri]